MRGFKARSSGAGALLCAGFVLASCSGDDPGSPGARPPGDPLRQAIATATLAPVGESGVSATATFAATGSGVDVTLVMRGCAGVAEKPLRILEARSCDGVGASSAVWGGSRGRDIPGVLCTSGTSGEGLLRYSRRSSLPDHWTIGDASGHDVLGHAVALFDPVTGAPTACGVVERGPDRRLVALPGENEAPSIEARAQLAGLCVARLTGGGAGAECAVPKALAACAAEHCELGACVEACKSFTACLDSSPDPCNATCEPSSACGDCQASATSCAFGFCGAHMSCPALPRPDGPCSHVMACCTLQGPAAGQCFEVGLLLANIAGEASCISALADWDMVAHMHVPCDTEAAWNEAATPEPSTRPLQGDPCVTQSDCGNGVCVGAARTPILSSPGRCQPRAATPRLSAGAVGTMCTSDATCGGGFCAKRTALLTPYPDGYCTGRCYEDATCGDGAVCLMPRGASDPGHCLQACESDADCPRQHYRCTPLGDGVRVIQACYPRGDPLPDHVAGRPCQSDADCADGAAKCLQGLTLSTLPPAQIVPASGGYCSAPCLFDADCGAGAQCISGGVSGGKCLSICNAGTPCRDGYLCTEHDRDHDPTATVCLPNWE
jgi:hypothetical protein